MNDNKVTDSGLDPSNQPERAAFSYSSQKPSPQRIQPQGLNGTDSQNGFSEPLDMVEEHRLQLQRKTEQMAKERENNRPEWYGTKKKKIAGDIIRTLVIVLAAALIVLLIWHYRGIRLVYQAELGEGRPDASVFFKDGTEASYWLGKEPSLTEQGTYVEILRSGRWVHVVLLKVKDTKAPEGENADISITSQESVSPIQAVTNVHDASEWTAEWVDQPTFGSSGIIKTNVLLSDSYGNSSEVPVTITIFEPIASLSWSMGTEKPTADEFVEISGHNVAFVTDMDTITWDVMGEYEITLSIDGYIYTSTLVISDGDAPVLTTKDLVIEKNTVVTPEDFVDSCTDASQVTFTFTVEPDTSKVDVLNVGIVATDSEGNQTEERAELTIVDYIAVVEASRDPLTNYELLGRLGLTVDEDELDEKDLLTPNVLGSQFVTVNNGNNNVSVYLTVNDTTAPSAVVQEIQGYVQHPLDPMSFAAEIDDATQVTASYKMEPSWDKEGKTTGSIILMDEAGNQTILNVTADLVKDTEAPEIYAAIDRTCYVGEAVTYLKEVYAVDNADGEVEVQVDKSAVNSREEGDYPVTYTATDLAGNSSSVTVTYHFIEQTVTDEMLDEMVDDIFADIFTDGMDVVDQARAIYNYVYGHIYYTGTADHSDWKGEAYRGYTDGEGDCYTYYSLTYVLLSHINCEVMSVERIDGLPGHEEHYWCLVNLGSGWYHFDTINVAPDDVQCFMWTQEECDSHSTHFWKFDTTLYPALATEPFDLE